MAHRFLPACALAVAAFSAWGCSPTVRVEAPRDPIVINLNVRLDAEVRVRLEERAAQTIQANPGVF